MIQSFRIIPPLAATLVFALAPAIAAGPGCDGFDVASHLFEVSDHDGSDTLSLEEYEDAGLARFGAPFEAYDANGDGETSYDEFIDLYDAHHPSPDELES